MTDKSSRQQHPEADLLAGFAEDSLTRNERESVLSHLAVCARCRQVVFLAHEVEPRPDIRSSELTARPSWLQNWFPVMASAAAVVVLAGVTFFWYGKFNRQTTPLGGKIAQQRSASIPAGNENTNKATEVAPHPLPASTKQTGKAASKRVPTDGKKRQVVALSSPSNSEEALVAKARKLTEEAPQFAARRYSSELSSNSASKKAQSTGDMPSAVGATAETEDKAGYLPRATQTAVVGGRSKDTWNAAPSSSGAVASAQEYRQEGSTGASEWKQAPESKQVHGEGCVEPGVEDGCVMVRDRKSGKLYQVLFKGLRPQPGNGIAFTGVVHDGATFCMQGTLLEVITWAHQSSLNCAQPEAPKE